MTTASVARRQIAAAPAAEALPFPDELLEEIFLRLGGAADLARASAACASFRRIATAPPFLRRFRSLHAPPVLGFLDIHGFHPASPPHRSALARDADFTFSFLPEPRRWAVADARDGLVLLSRCITGAVDAFADLAVCDPLFRRYVLVPPIPDDLAASVPQRDRRRFTSFLAPPAGEHDDDGKEEGLSPQFSLIFAAVHSESKAAVAFVFRSGGNGDWRRVANHSSRSPPLPKLLFISGVYHRSYAHGCFYWIVNPMGSWYSLVLDTREMKFTDTDLPPLPPNNGSRAIVVDAGEGTFGLLTFDRSAIRLFRRARRNNASVGAAEEWQPYKTVPFPKSPSGKDYHWFRGLGAADGYLLVLGREFFVNPYAPCSWQYYTLDLKTLLFERLYASDPAVLSSSHIYARFPPLLAPSSI